MDFPEGIGRTTNDQWRTLVAQQVGRALQVLFKNICIAGPSERNRFPWKLSSDESAAT